MVDRVRGDRVQGLTGPIIGRSVPRRDDPVFLKGEATFVGDIQLPGMVHLVVVRSSSAHGRLSRVVTTEAQKVPGVVDVFSAADVEPYMKPLRSTRPFPDGLDRYRQLPLAVGEVRYVGQPIAVVVATERSIAEDAAAMVESEIEELPPVLEPGSGSAVHLITRESGQKLTESVLDADVQVEAIFRVHRNSGMPLETRGLVVTPESDGGVTVFGVTKLPAFIRAAIADLLGVPPPSVRVKPVAVGGGFGVRGELYAEDLLTVIAAVRTGRAVAWVEDRREHLTSINHARDSVWRVRASATKDGEIVALSGEVDIDAGAYLRTLVPAELDACELLGPYRLRAYRCDVRVWLTNKMGIGTMRAPGTFESTFVREMLLERLAGALGISPKQLRARNLLQPSEMPTTPGFELLGSTVVYDSADLPEAMRIAETAIRSDESVARQRAVAAGKRFGISVVPAILPTGIGPFETAKLAIEPPGIVAVHVATTSMGQAHTTSLAQIAAEAVGVPLELVSVVEGDPADVPASIGTFASRTITAAGTAVWSAGLQLREELSELIGEGEVDLAAALRAAEHDLVATARAEIPTLTYAYGAHAAQVIVDPELGSVDVVRYVVVADAGRIVNPQSAVDQVVGGAMFGIGGALFEAIEYSEDGQPLTSSFLDFLMPTVAEAPAFEVTLIDRARSSLNPLGFKGVGEIGTAAVGAAVAMAVQDAIGRDGDWIEELPVTPETVRRLIE